MPKIGNNPIMKGLSGMLGDVVVYREQRGTMVMSNRPKKPAAPTNHQKLQGSKFRQAVAYAHAQMEIPEAKAEYDARIDNKKFVSGFSVAVTDYLKGPEITAIEASEYRGQVGDPIVIVAIDNFKVTDVNVQIRSAADALIEEGPAIQNPANELAWIFATTQANAQLAGTKIVVRAKDKPNNVTTKELVLA
jgi:signal peptidase I